MIAAHKVGIPIFATGGIGGVHRGVEESKIAEILLLWIIMCIHYSDHLCHVFISSYDMPMTFICSFTLCHQLK